MIVSYAHNTDYETVFFKALCKTAFIDRRYRYCTGFADRRVCFGLLSRSLNNLVNVDVIASTTQILRYLYGFVADAYAKDCSYLFTVTTKMSASSAASPNEIISISTSEIVLDLRLVEKNNYTIKAV